jgi:hypothetical protein
MITMTQQPPKNTRLQITLSGSVLDYLELKSQLTGRPAASLIADLTFEAMRAEYRELKDLQKAIEHDTDTD